MNIEYYEKLSDEQAKFINSEFSKHSAQYGLNCNYNQFNFIAKKENKIIGILSGHSLYYEIHIGELVVSENYRGNGVGTSLLKHIEDFYKDKDFKYLSLSTHEFQARKFYEKCGFELEFVRENKSNPKLTKYFFVKYL